MYPLGSFIVLKNIVSDKEGFLDGHSHDITCIAMSHDGNKLASGQTQFAGVKVILLSPYQQPSALTSFCIFRLM